MKPTIGRTVHYVVPMGCGPASGKHRAAIITDVVDAERGIVNLLVFKDAFDGRASDGYNCRPAHRPYAPPDSESNLDTWHWPERE